MALCPACKKKKKEVEPVNTVRYTTFNNTVLSYNNHPPSVDIDGDGNMDFAYSVGLLQVDNENITTFKLLRNPNNQIAVSNIDAAYAFGPNASLQNALDNNQLSWQSVHGVLLSKHETNNTSYKSGAFNNAVDRYVGLRIKKGDAYHYGWIKLTHRLNAAGNDELAISQTAVETVAEKPITTL